MLDVLVIGAGPAGVQAAYYLRKAGVSFELIERSSTPGSFFETFPRHRKLISINKKHTGSDDPEFNLRHDWNSLLCDDDLRFTEFDDALFPQADNFLLYIAEFVEANKIEISYGSEVRCIDAENGVFTAHLTNGRVIQTRRVIVATGFARSRVPSIEGIEHAIDYGDMSIDPMDFVNQRVLVIGKGNSAFETADHLAGSAALLHLVSPSPLRMAWNTHYVGNLRAVNNNILDMYQLKSQHAILDAKIISITKSVAGLDVTFAYSHAQGEVETISYDKVLTCAGFMLDASIFAPSCAPARAYEGKFPWLTNSYESINVPGMYFAGTLTHSLDYRKGTSGFIHGFRYNVKALVSIICHRALGRPIEPIADSDIETFGRCILGRVNVVSSIWQQPAVLAEFFRFDDERYQHYEALPVEYGVEDYFAKDKVVALTFEYGSHMSGDIFNQSRIARDNLGQASDSQFLHPVLRYYDCGVLRGEHHVIEDLEAKWTCSEHLEGIDQFLARVTDAQVDEMQGV